MKAPVILIADTNPRILRFLAAEFADAGFEVVSAGSAEEVFRKIDAFPAPCLLVLDPDLPRFGGKAVMNRIAAGQVSIPVIVYSPYDEYAQDPVYRKAAAFVEKTANPVSLISTVKKLLTKGHA